MSGRLILVVEPSQGDSALWRFGLIDAPTPTWGLLTREESGSIELLQDETDVGLSHFVTAACLVRMAFPSDGFCVVMRCGLTRANQWTPLTRATLKIPPM